MYHCLNKLGSIIMCCSEKVLVLTLILVAVVPNLSCQQLGKCNTERHPQPAADENMKNCSDCSTCPTWFICGSNKTCQGGNRHGGAVTCDNKRLIASVLDGNCVTYDMTSQSTFVGACFYNCVNLKNQKDFVYHCLPMKPEHLINNSACTRFLIQTL